LNKRGSFSARLCQTLYGNMKGGNPLPKKVPTQSKGGFCDQRGGGKGGGVMCVWVLGISSKENHPAGKERSFSSKGKREDGLREN